MFTAITPTAAEREAPRAGDDLVAPADVVMDRSVTLPGHPEQVWPWVVQLGKSRAGWYLPRRLERLLPRARRATRTLRPEWLTLEVGDVVPDYGGAGATFTVAEIDAPHALVYRSRRGRTELTWSLTLEPIHGADGRSRATRLHLRLRLAPVRRVWLASSVGDLFDALTVAGMAAGLRERLLEH